MENNDQSLNIDKNFISNVLSKVISKIIKQDILIDVSDIDAVVSLNNETKEKGHNISPNEVFNVTELSENTRSGIIKKLEDKHCKIKIVTTEGICRPGEVAC